MRWQVERGERGVFGNPSLVVADLYDKFDRLEPRSSGEPFRG
jgi:hypothetical protein